MRKLSIVLLFVCSLLSINSGFASENVDGNAIPRKAKVVTLSTCPFFRNLTDDIIYSVCLCLARFRENSLLHSNQRHLLLSIWCIIDQLYAPDWSAMEITVHELFFVYAKLQEFVRIRKKFPNCLDALFKNDRYILNSLGLKLAAKENEKMAAELIARTLVTLETNRPSTVDSALLLPGFGATSPSDTNLKESIVLALNRVFKVTLGLHFGLEMMGVEGCDRVLTPTLACGLFSADLLNTCFGYFLAYPKKKIPPIQSQLIFKNINAFLLPGEKDVFAMIECANHVRFAKTFDMETINARVFAAIANAWHPSRNSSHLFISQVWDREESAQDVKALGAKIMASTASPYAVLACDPEMFFERFGTDLFETDRFVDFVYDCTVFDRTICRTAFDELIFKFMLGQCHSQSIPDALIPLLVAVINLATARNRPDVSMPLCELGLQNRNKFGYYVYLAVGNRPTFVYEGPLLEAYIAGDTIDSRGMGRIVSSAVIRNDTKLLDHLGRKLRLELEPRLRPYVDFPSASIYIDRYCSIFDLGSTAIDIAAYKVELRNHLDDHHKTSYQDTWAIGHKFSDAEIAIVSSLTSDANRFSTEAFVASAATF